MRATEVTVEGPTVIINENLCKGCQLCIHVCAPEVLKISEGFNDHGYHPALYVGQGCTACGVCYYTCPEPGAIVVVKAPRKSRS